MFGTYDERYIESPLKAKSPLPCSLVFGSSLLSQSTRQRNRHNGIKVRARLEKNECHPRRSAVFRRIRPLGTKFQKGMSEVRTSCLPLGAPGDGWLAHNGSELVEESCGLVGDTKTFVNSRGS
jgi:hypothetical protein